MSTQLPLPLSDPPAPVAALAPATVAAVAPELARLARSFGEALARLEAPGVETHRLIALGARVWIAAAQGHVCVEREPGDPAESDAFVSITTELQARAAPLVLDDNAFYLARLWRAETGLARRVVEIDTPAPWAEPSDLEAAVTGVFDHRDPDDAQQQAVLRALSRRLCVITGGPGTGKTTTLARLLVALARLRPGLRVAYCAPTGKAAARLAQALAQQIGSLDPGGEIATRLPEGGLTVHRLLGRQRDSIPVEQLDLVIVDEASMMDIELADELFGRLGPQTRLVLAGDRDQLASVEAGAVFAELCEAGLQGMVRLTRNWRQREAPGIAALAAAIRQGDVGTALDDADDRRWCAPRAAELIDRALRAFGDALMPLRAGPLAGDELARAVSAGCERFRVLCAQRAGPLGSLAINAAIAARLGGAHSAWYPGRLVMVTRNVASRQLFNGDVGVCLPWAARGGRLAVAFVDAAGVRWVPLSQMPACEDAWAITVHKAQGSEFETVVLVPAPAGHPLATRELLYTGVTRARSRLLLFAVPDQVRDAASRPALRHGRLARRVGGLRAAFSPSRA